MIEDPNTICLDENTVMPLKQFFFPQRSVIFSFQGTKITIPRENIPSRVFFGVRRCDLNAIRHQDMMYMEKFKDPIYIARRQASVLIGYHCPMPPSKYCFCGSHNLGDYYDLMFFDRGSEYHVHIGSLRGEEFFKKYTNHFTPINKEITEQDKKIPGSDRLKRTNIKDLYHHPDWIPKGVDRCISCAACTTLCPTCYCSEMHDEQHVGATKIGNRVRTWSSCQLKEFTKVAGGHTFRESREGRFKHRIYHQMEYFKQKNGVTLCVGCGRCIQSCPTDIDWVDIINKMGDR